MPILFVTGIVTACLFTGVSVLMRMKFPDRRRPEWILAGLIVLGVFAIWYSLVYVRGWEGAALGMAFSEPLPDICRKGYLAIQEKITGCCLWIMSNCSQAAGIFFRKEKYILL